MHPIERLRWIARASGEPASTIAGEAAWTLGELAENEPAAVLTASRRLVERHPACGPLWWVCAKLITSDDAYREASVAAEELTSDRAGHRIAGAIRSEFTASDPLAATIPTELLRDALTHRPEYSVRILGDWGELRREVRSVGVVASEVTGYDIDEVDMALEGAAVLLVEPLLASPRGLLVPVSAGRAIEVAANRSVPVWGLLGAGRVLPPGLAAAAAEMAGDEYELVDPDRFSLAVDDKGRGPAQPALARTTCPPCPELVPRGTAAS